MSVKGFLLKLFLIVFVVIGAGFGGGVITFAHPVLYVLWLVACFIAGYGAGYADFD